MFSRFIRVTQKSVGKEKTKNKNLPVWVLESKNVLVVSTVIVPMVPSVICALESRRPRYLCNIGKRILDNIYKIHQKFFLSLFCG